MTTAFFDVLCVRPIAGRTFVAADNQTRNVTVIGERFWRSRFGADPHLIGRSITLDGEPVVVVGIVPAGFQLLFESDLWVPFVPRPVPDPANRPTAHYQMVSPGYFRALGIPLVRGRAFTARDLAESPQICIVNEELVRRYFRGRDPLGVTMVVYAMGPQGRRPCGARSPASSGR